MGLMEFEAGKKKVLFFTRGRGRGHAVPDIAIARNWQTLRPDIDLRFVSYGTGAQTFTAHGIPVIDLQMPDQNSIAATTVLAGRAIAMMNPDLVVAHEEFTAMPVAKIFGLPTVMITDFFSEPGLLSMESLWFADRILFLGRRGPHLEPPSVKGRVRYVGPMLRQFAYTRRDRRRAREELGLPANATVITVLPGSWTEAMAPVYDQVMAAYAGLRATPKHLIWLAGADGEFLREQTRRRSGVTILDTDWQIDRLMAASDLALTKANRMTVMELAALGIRTLSLSQGLNPADERSIAGLASNQTLPPAQLTAERLAAVLAAPEPKPVRRRGSCAVELAKLLG